MGLRRICTGLALHLSPRLRLGTPKVLYFSFSFTPFSLPVNFKNPVPAPIKEKIECRATSTFNYFCSVGTVKLADFLHIFTAANESATANFCHYYLIATDITPVFLAFFFDSRFEVSFLTYISLYFGPSPPSGTSHFMTWWGHFMRHVWQCTQLDGLKSRLSSSNLYTSPGQKNSQGWQPYSAPQRLHSVGSENVMWEGSSSRWLVPERLMAVNRSMPPSYFLFRFTLLIPS